EAGAWSVTTEGEERTSVAVSGESELGIRLFRFVAPGGRPGHEGLFAIDGAPLVGQPQQVLVRLDAPVTTAQLELRDLSGELLVRYDLTSLPDASDSYLAEVILPDAPFIAYVTGTTLTHEPFQRAIKRAQRAQYLELMAPADDFA